MWNDAERWGIIQGDVEWCRKMLRDAERCGMMQGNVDCFNHLRIRWFIFYIFNFCTCFFWASIYWWWWRWRIEQLRLDFKCICDCGHAFSSKTLEVISPIFFISFKSFSFSKSRSCLIVQFTKTTWSNLWDQFFQH